MAIGAAARRIAARHAVWLASAIAGAAVLLLAWPITQPEELFSDYYKAYYPAAALMLSDGPVAPWSAPEMRSLGFINIPIVAYLFVPLALLGEAATGWAYLAVGAAAIAAAWTLMRRLAGGEPWPGALLFFVLANGPLLNGLREGNTTHFLLLLLALALLLWTRGRDFAAGAVLGVVAVLKLPFLLFGLFFLLRGRWRIVAGGAAAIGAILLASLAVFGLGIHREWIECCVEPYLGAAVPAFNVQSIDGWLLRLETGLDELDVYEPHDPSTLHRAARLLAAAALVATPLWLLRKGDRAAAAPSRRPGAQPRDLLEFAIVLVLALVISPVSWTHYYLLLLLPWALYLGGRLPLPDDGATRALMWSGYLLAALPVVTLPLDEDWLGELAARTLVSAWLFGGLLMLTALVRGAWHAAYRAKSGHDQAEARAA
jgi:alpha-1,2-mannosyltransferase